MLQGELNPNELEVIRKAKANWVHQAKAGEWTQAEIMDALTFYAHCNNENTELVKSALKIVCDSWQYEFVNLPTSNYYEVFDWGKFSQVQSLDIVKHNQSTNVEVILQNGERIESQGEHGPNDFAEYGFKISRYE